MCIWINRRKPSSIGKLSKSINENVMLKYPTWEDEFYIVADGSRAGVAAVLSQKDSATGKLRHLSYFSSSLSGSQANNSAGQLEAWALVAVACKWKFYLKAKSSVVFQTEHNPLQGLRSQSDPKQIFSRWLMELEAHPYRIEFRPGKLNQVADYLSRNANNKYDQDDESKFEERIYILKSPIV